jgi:dTDP-4-dehydrorhamnose 3,5-epimerase
MNFTRTEIPDVVAIEPQAFADERGAFFESFNVARYEAALRRPLAFVQDNQSVSRRGVVRGLHYQLPPKAQGKLVRAVKGEIFDVAVDLRKGSATFGRWAGRILSESNGLQLWIPEGFAHGFQAVSEEAIVLYKTTDYWSQAHERCIRWDDKALAIAWPDAGAAIVSAKDKAGINFERAELFESGSARKSA